MPCRWPPATVMAALSASSRGGKLVVRCEDGAPLCSIRGGRLEPALARQVAVHLMAHNAFEAHARDELGITETLRARPIQAAIASAVSFSVGAGVPLL